MQTAIRLLRVILCGAVGALIGLGVGLVAASSGMYFGVSAPWGYPALGALVGLAGRAGYESARRSSAFLWGAASLFTSFVWGGLLVLGVKAGVGAPPLVSAAMPLGVFGLGLLAWALLAGRVTALAEAERPLFPGAVELALGALSGAAFGLGYGLLFALTYAPCGQPGRHEYCIDFGPWYGLTTILLLAAIVGLAVGVVLAFALTVGARLRLLEPAHD
jgi:hypothetical protein